MWVSSFSLKGVLKFGENYNFCSTHRESDPRHGGRRRWHLAAGPSSRAGRSQRRARRIWLWGRRQDRMEEWEDTYGHGPGTEKMGHKGGITTCDTFLLIRGESIEERGGQADDGRG